MQFSFGVDAKVFDVFGCLGLDLRVLDGEAVVGRRFVLFLPSGSVINLEQVNV